MRLNTMQLNEVKLQASLSFQEFWAIANGVDARTGSSAKEAIGHAQDRFMWSVSLNNKCEALVHKWLVHPALRLPVMRPNLIVAVQQELGANSLLMNVATISDLLDWVKENRKFITNPTEYEK